MLKMFGNWNLEALTNGPLFNFPVFAGAHHQFTHAPRAEELVAFHWSSYLDLGGSGTMVGWIWFGV